MKIIIRPFKLLELTDELQRIEGHPGVTVSKIKGFGKSRVKNAKDRVVYKIDEEVVKIRTNERGIEAI